MPEKVAGRAATLVALSMQDPAASVQDPAFKALIGQGYNISASLPAQRGDRTEWLLLMTPPQLDNANAVSLSRRDWLLIGTAFALHLVAQMVGFYLVIGGAA